MRITENHQREIHFRSNKSRNSISQSTSTDWMKQQVEASRTNRMRNTLDLLSKQNTSGSASKPEGAF